MILPEWTARREADVSPPAGFFFLPFRREERLHRSPDRFSNDKQTGIPMGDVSPSPATGRYFEKLFGIYFRGYPFIMNAPEAVGA